MLKAVQFSSNGNKLATAAYDNKVMVWDLNTNSLIQTIDMGGYVSNIAFFPYRSYSTASLQDCIVDAYRTF
jgi:WD40 repeat protein